MCCEISVAGFAGGIAGLALVDGIYGCEEISSGTGRDAVLENQIRRGGAAGAVSGGGGTGGTG